MVRTPPRSRSAKPVSTIAWRTWQSCMALIIDGSAEAWNRCHSSICSRSWVSTSSTPERFRTIADSIAHTSLQNQAVGTGRPGLFRCLVYRVVQNLGNPVGQGQPVLSGNVFPATDPVGVEAQVDIRLPEHGIFVG